MAAQSARKKSGAKATPAAVKRRAKAAVAPDSKGEALLRAGLKALGEVRDGVVQRQRVVETLIGDSLGFRKLEDVFDQRIAAALERLGMPSAAELAALREQVRVLAEERDRALAAVGRRPPSATPARRKR
ncbi:MAG: phasin family protein [Variovorax sp.]